jgi:hypothetical protein
MKIAFPKQTLENIQMSNFMIIYPEGAELFHADERTDRQTKRHEEAKGGFCNFANMPKNVSVKCNISTVLTFTEC